MAAIPVFEPARLANLGLLLGVHWLDQPGWRWLFIVEGFRRSSSGFTTLWYLTDWPREATWLPEDEKQWIIRELETRSSSARRRTRSRCGRR
jgi:ACS family tartrate transporter-like MFS transporter